MKIIIKAASWLLAFIGIGYCVVRLTDNYNSLPVINYNSFMIIKMFMLVCAVTALFTLLSEGWRLILVMCAVQLSSRQSFMIMGLSQIGKYLPGNVFQYVGRVGMGVQNGASSYLVLSATIWLETVALIIASSLIIVAGSLIDNDSRVWLINILHAELLKVLLVTAGFGISTFVGWRILKIKLETSLFFWKSSLVLKILSFYLVFIIVSGCLVKFVPAVLWGNSDGSFSFLKVIWGYSLCWLAGLIVPGAPAGLGVREAMFTKLFSPELGEGGAACVALVFRVLTTAGDLLTFAIAWWIGRRVINKDDSEFKTNSDC